MSDKETKFGQYVGTGEHDPADHAKNVDEETAAHGLTASTQWDMAPGANQGGPAGPTPPIK